MLGTHPRASLRCAIALGTTALFFSSSTAHAEPSASERKLAKEMLREAIADEKAGRCEDAINTLRQVAAMIETGEGLLHLGECLSKTGRLLEAIKTWERAEDLARRDKDRLTQQALVPKLAALHGRIPTLALQVPADAQAVVITIDGNAVLAERIRVPIELDPGEHTIEVKAEGRSPFTKKLKLAEKDTTAVSASLPRLVPTAADGASGGGVPLGTWIAGSAALVLAGGGVGAFVAAGTAASNGRANCSQATSCDAATVRSVRQLDTAALALWIGAGVGMGMAVTLFVVGRSSPKPVKAPAAAAPLRLRMGLGALQIEGAF